MSAQMWTLKMGGFGVQTLWIKELDKYHKENGQIVMLDVQEWKTLHMKWIYRNPTKVTNNCWMYFILKILIHQINRYLYTIDILLESKKPFKNT